MRLIDEKGRVFGRINIIDLGFIILFVLLVGEFVRGCLTISGVDKIVYDKVKYDIRVEETARIEKELKEKRDEVNNDLLKASKLKEDNFKENERLKKIDEEVSRFRYLWE